MNQSVCSYYHHPYRSVIRRRRVEESHKDGRISIATLEACSTQEGYTGKRRGLEVPAEFLMNCGEKGLTVEAD
jgi:hypothetical protein